MLNYRFISNIYDPSLKDSDEKLLSPNYGVKDTNKKSLGSLSDAEDIQTVSKQECVSAFSPEKALNYIRNVYLKDKLLGVPIPPKNSSLTSDELQKMGYVGVYAKESLDHRRCAPSIGLGDELYPKVAVYDSETGEVIRVISHDHTV